MAVKHTVDAPSQKRWTPFERKFFGDRHLELYSVLWVGYSVGRALLDWDKRSPKKGERGYYHIFQFL